MLEYFILPFFILYNIFFFISNDSETYSEDSKSLSVSSPILLLNIPSFVKASNKLKFSASSF